MVWTNLRSSSNDFGPHDVVLVSNDTISGLLGDLNG